MTHYWQLGANIQEDTGSTQRL